MSTVESLPFAEEMPARMIQSTPGRLGTWPANVAVARVGLPWRRRLSKAALLLPKVRYYEKQFLAVSDDKLLDHSMQLRGKARGKWDLDTLLEIVTSTLSLARDRATAAELSRTAGISVPDPE